jgi:hypothetical protein
MHQQPQVSSTRGLGELYPSLDLQLFLVFDAQPSCFMVMGFALCEDGQRVLPDPIACERQDDESVQHRQSAFSTPLQLRPQPPPTSPGNWGRERGRELLHGELPAIGVSSVRLSAPIRPLRSTSINHSQPTHGHCLNNTLNISH